MCRIIQRSTILLLALGWTSSAAAYITMPKESIAHKLAVADSVVLGKITAVADTPVKGRLWRYSDAAIWELTVVDVAVSEVFAGPPDEKVARFAFLSARLQGGSYETTPKVGQTGCFFGVRIGKADYCIVPTGGYLEEHGETFAKDVDYARRGGRLLGDPAAGLKSKDPADRVHTAHLLLLRSIFAPFRYGETGKSEPLDAELSRQAMLALAEADWDVQGAEMKESLACLEWGALHGAPPPKGLPTNRESDAWPAAAKAWLKDNAEKYRISRIFKGEKASEKAGQ
jgi:hypothetical protein